MFAGHAEKSDSSLRAASLVHVFPVTVTSSTCGDNPLNSTRQADLMSDKIRNSTAQLEELVTRVMKEKDPAQYDELCSELWLVLYQRDAAFLALKAELADQVRRPA